MTSSRLKKPFHKLSCRFSAPLLIVLGLVNSTAAYAQVSAQTQSVNFGSVNIGSSANLTLNYCVESSEALGTPNVLTQGAPNLDFTLGSGGTCSNLTLLGGSCTVNVTFLPKFAGPRNGAVEVVDASGNVLATTYVHGIGVGPQATFADTTSGVFTVTPAATFTITPIPPSETVFVKGSAAWFSSCNPSKASNGEVTLSCSGGPAGTKCADLPGTIYLNGTAYAVSSVLFPNNTPEGTYTITLTGVSGSLTNKATATFTVQ